MRHSRPLGPLQVDAEAGRGPWIQAGLSSGAVLALTVAHHLYGAALYDAAFRRHALAVALPYGLLIAGLLAAGWRRRFTRPGARLGALAAWVILLGPVAVIGVYEGAYNHILKTLLHFSGVSEGVFEQLFPAPLYERPSDLFFEASGALQALLAVWAGCSAQALRRRAVAR